MDTNCYQAITAWSEKRMLLNVFRFCLLKGSNEGEEFRYPTESDDGSAESLFPSGAYEGVFPLFESDHNFLKCPSMRFTDEPLGGNLPGHLPLQFVGLRLTQLSCNPSTHCGSHMGRIKLEWLNYFTTPVGLFCTAGSLPWEASIFCWKLPGALLWRLSIFP